MAGEIICAGLCGTTLSEGQLWLANGAYVCAAKLADGACGAGYWTNGWWCAELGAAIQKSEQSGGAAIFAVLDGQIGEQALAGTAAA